MQKRASVAGGVWLKIVLTSARITVVLGMLAYVLSGAGMVATLVSEGEGAAVLCPGGKSAQRSITKACAALCS